MLRRVNRRRSNASCTISGGRGSRRAGSDWGSLSDQNARPFDIGRRTADHGSPAEPAPTTTSRRRSRPPQPLTTHHSPLTSAHSPLTKPRKGFTMIEVLMVVIIIGILIALLLPAIQGAIRTAKQAAVQSEVNALAQALASFKSKYGDYPPSRVLLVENGNYGQYMSSAPLSSPADTIGGLAQRSLIAMRKLFPRVILSSSNSVPPQLSNTYFYDFNGNGIPDPHGYILQGDQCLVFFLGGIPTYDPASQTYGLSGFGKDPNNPFTNNISTFAMYNPNRQPPLYEFNPGRLFADPFDVGNANLPTPTSSSAGGGGGGIPGYYDSLGNAPPGTGGNNTLNFFVYFSGYGSGVYDPNDVNFPMETDATPAPGGGPPIGLSYLWNGISDPSASPNPYTSTLTNNIPAGALPNGSPTFINAQTFQLFSPGLDGLYGVGGQFIAQTQANSTVTNSLPPNLPNTYSGTTTSTDSTVRQRESDNMTNFKQGPLQ